MPDPNIRFGSDLRLLQNLAQQNTRNPPSDLSKIRRTGTGLPQAPVDLETLSATDNLKQALLLRFLTSVGDLTILGHPDYGCRLSDLIGELNDDGNRNRAKLFVLQALADEPRVQEVISVVVTQHPGDRTRMDISVALKAINSDTILNLVFPFFLQGGAIQ
jgi:phage baseplate assembly protein W